ncbi:DUF2911 domain-containing protein [Hymenobacter guriensis]|uniref:DUF2911 domain-containing protein n=1 Tax=Hymenobacter guriensis TaxID=2793065 RepID=A0ABS0L3S1_9BACT|nr:DUF2911 domain-containing protein [Hymenobacter guriensis]MBG8554769.1 DUF2911 domain-containing protein [Hymenobacter guriensis]
MKNFLRFGLLSALWLACLLLSFDSLAQAKKPEDKSKRPSPPAAATAKTPAGTITIDYSRPSVKGRKVFGGLVPLGQVWRTGANEATTFSVDKNVLVQGQALPAGKYALFSIPGDQEWTIIFNKVPDQWGAYEYKQDQDALRVQVPAKTAATPTEQLTFQVTKSGKVTLLWDKAQVDFAVTAAK